MCVLTISLSLWVGRTVKKRERMDSTQPPRPTGYQIGRHISISRSLGDSSARQQGPPCSLITHLPEASASRWHLRPGRPEGHRSNLPNSSFLHREGPTLWGTWILRVSSCSSGPPSTTPLLTSASGMTEPQSWQEGAVGGTLRG